jgi:transcriptional regulator with XRE-family HTH domain
VTGKQRAQQRREAEKSWGARVFDKREALDLSQAQLADLAGVTQQTISKIENNTLVPRIGTMEAIAGALGTTVDLLFPWASRPQKPAVPA